MHSTNKRIFQCENTKPKLSIQLLGPLHMMSNSIHVMDINTSLKFIAFFERCGIDGDYGRGKPIYVIYTYMNYFLDVIYAYFKKVLIVKVHNYYFLILTNIFYIPIVNTNKVCQSIVWGITEKDNHTINKQANCLLHMSHIPILMFILSLLSHI